MNVKALYLLTGAAAATVLFGCAAGMVNTSQSIPSALVAKEYNDVSAQYVDRPTFVSIEIMRDGSKVLAITMRTFGVNAFGSNDRTVRIFEADRQGYIDAIDKYFAWEKRATERNDRLEKEIVVVKCPNGFKHALSFYSGNEALHFFVISFADSGLLGKIRVPAMVFDRSNAATLRQMLTDLPSKSGKVVADDYK